MTAISTEPAGPAARLNGLARLRRGGKMLFRVGLKLSALRSSLVFGMSGAAFAVGNLLLARVMPVQEFGAFALAVALFNVFNLLAPLGIDQIVLRHRIDPGPRLLGYLLGFGACIGMIVGWLAVQFEHLDAEIVPMLAIAICMGGIVITTSNALRAAMRERSALIIVTGASWVLLGIGLLALLIPMETARLPFTLFAIGEVFIAVVGWLILVKRHRIPAADRERIPWREAGSLLGMAAIGTLSLQLERLIIPAAIGVEALAVFSVLASVAIFPFRMATAGLGFALTPRIRAEADLAERRKIVRHELASVLVVLVIASTIIVLVAPFAASWLTAGRYKLDVMLVLAACANGSAKVVHVVPRAILTASGSGRDLSILNGLGWAGFLLAIIGGVIGALWGLTGLVLGVTAGSIVGSIPALVLAAGSLRRHHSS